MKYEIKHKKPTENMWIHDEWCKDEKELIKKFKEYIEKYAWVKFKAIIYS